jgi:hypothetical protein
MWTLQKISNEPAVYFLCQEYDFMRGMLYLPAIKLVCLAYIICTFYIYNYILNLQIALPYIVRATAYTW